MAELAKKLKTTQNPKIGTHNGTFHADEALACFILKQIDTYHHAEIIRTRDEAILKELDIVVDVGGEYVPERHRYDHHQRGFSQTFPHHSTKLSSAGLIYLHFGKQVVSNVLKLPIDHANVEITFVKVYQDFIEAMDGIDNGIPQYDGVARYKSRTDLSSRVGALNPSWNEPTNDVQSRFEKAMEMTGNEFLSCVRYVGFSWLPARDIVLESIASRSSVDPSGKIIVLSQFCPWKEHLFLIENELNIPDQDKPLYMLYADSNGTWRVQAIPPHSDTFECRKPLPEAWRGLRDAELSAVCGIPNCIFVHASGFIGGNQTKEGALEMTKLALTL